jgi:hypothetical protein
MLSPEEIQDARKQYGLDTPTQSSGSGFGTNTAPVDHAARMARLRGLTSPAPSKEPGSFMGDVGNALKQTASGVGQALQMAPGSVDKTKGGWLENLKQTAEAGLQGVGSLAKGVTDIASSAFHRSGADEALKNALKIGPVGYVWDKIPEEDKSAVKEGLGHLAQGASDQYNSWKAQNPRAAKDVENIAHIAGAIPLVEGGAAAVEAAPKLLGETLPNLAKATTEGLGATAKELAAGGEEALVGQEGKVLVASGPLPAKDIESMSYLVKGVIGSPK